MIYGIEDTTDTRYPETKIMKFTSRERALAWVAEDQGYAWGGSAKADIAAQQQNWHSRLRALYEMPKGWKPPSKTELQREVAQRRGMGWRRRAEDILGSHIRREGERLRK